MVDFVEGALPNETAKREQQVSPAQFETKPPPNGRVDFQSN